MNIKHNLYKNEKHIRTFMGIMFISSAIYFDIWWLGIFAVISFLTSSYEYCPVHEVLGLNENEAKRNDMEFMYVAAWQYNKDGKPKLFKENLEYKNVKLKTRSYK